MGRFLFFLLLILLVYLAVKSFRRSAAGKKAKDGGERMVHCEHCGLYLPESEAVSADGRNYCSAEHQRIAGR
jgi:uncharacterized protein